MHGDPIRGAAVFLLSTYNSARRVAERADEELQLGRKVVIITFHELLHEFMQPVQEHGVLLLKMGRGMQLGLYRPWQWIQCRREISHMIENCLSRFVDCTVYTYSIGYELKYLAAIGALLRSNRVIFENLDSDMVTGVCDQVCVSAVPRALGRLASWVTRTPIVYYRRLAPVPRHHKRVHSHPNFTIVERDEFKPTAVGGACVKSLMKSCDAKILFVFDGDAVYHKSRMNREKFENTWRQLLEVLGSMVLPSEMCLKAHPGLPESELGLFAEIPAFPSAIPLEFVEFTRLRLVVGVGSYSLHRFVNEKKAIVSTIVPLLEMEPSLREHYNQLLATWVDPENDIVRLTSISQLTGFKDALLGKNGQRAL